MNEQVITGNWIRQKRPYINKIKETLKKDFFTLKSLDDISFFRRPFVKDFVHSGVVTGFCKIQNKLFKFKMRYKVLEGKMFLKPRYTSFLQENIASNTSIEPKLRDKNMYFYQSVLGIRRQPLRTESIFYKEEVTEVIFETEEIAQQFLELAIKNCRKIG